MIDIQKYIMYCAGQGYLNKRKFDEDTSFDRRVNRVFEEGIERTLKAAQNAPPPATSALFARGENAPPPSPVVRFLNQLAQAIFTPFQILGNLTRQIFQTAPRVLSQVLSDMAAQAGRFLQESAGQLANAAGQVLAFFFGFKKDKTEEKDRRNLDDVAFADVFGDQRTVEETHQGGMGGQG